MASLMNSQHSLSILQITGTDAQTYLQNLITADIAQLQEAHWIIAAFCSPQGKVQAMLRIAKIAQEYFVIVPEMLSQALYQRFKLFSLNRSIQLQLRPDLALEALSTNNNNAQLQTHCLQLGGISGFSALDNIKSQFAQILPATQDQFLPQMLGLEQNGGLSYTKGCYIGQEVIARAQSRAPVRKHLCCIRSQTPQEKALTAGERLYCENQPAASIIESALEQDYLIALAVVQDRYRETALQDSAGNIYLCH